MIPLEDRMKRMDRAMKKWIIIIAFSALGAAISPF
jgi:hypothetical protein